jgi:hypothetical protein
MFTFNGSIDIAKLKAKESARKVARLFYILQKETLRKSKYL